MLYINNTIVVDCFRNDKEARALLQLGILPTHVFHLIGPFAPDLTELIYCHVHEGWPEYRRTISRLRDAFKHNLHVYQSPLQSSQIMFWSLYMYILVEFSKLQEVKYHKKWLQFCIRDSQILKHFCYSSLVIGAEFKLFLSVGHLIFICR